MHLVLVNCCAVLDLVKALTGNGGRDAGDATRRIIRQRIHSEAIHTFEFHGRRGKTGIGNFHITAVNICKLFEFLFCLCFMLDF